MRLSEYFVVVFLVVFSAAIATAEGMGLTVIEGGEAESDVVESGSYRIILGGVDEAMGSSEVSGNGIVKALFIKASSGSDSILKFASPYQFQESIKIDLFNCRQNVEKHNCVLLGSNHMEFASGDDCRKTVLASTDELYRVRYTTTEFEGDRNKPRHFDGEWYIEYLFRDDHFIFEMGIQVDDDMLVDYVNPQMLNFSQERIDAYYCDKVRSGTWDYHNWFGRTPDFLYAYKNGQSYIAYTLIGISTLPRYSQIAFDSFKGCRRAMVLFGNCGQHQPNNPDQPYTLKGRQLHTWRWRVDLGGAGDTKAGNEDIARRVYQNAVESDRSKPLSEDEVTPVKLEAGRFEKQVIPIGQGQRLRAWQYNTGGWVRSVEVSEAGDRIAAGSVNKHVYLFHSDGRKLWEYETGGIVNDVSLTGDGNAVTAASWDGRVYRLNRKGGLAWTHELGDLVNSVATSADGAVSVAGSSRGEVCSIAADGRIAWETRVPCSVQELSVSATGRLAAIGSTGGAVLLLDDRGRELREIRTTLAVNAIDVSATSGLGAASVWFSGARLFDENGNSSKSIPIPGGYNPLAISISGNGKRIAVAGLARNRDVDNIYVLDENGEILWANRVGLYALCAGVSHDGKVVAVGTADNHVHCFNESGELLWSHRFDAGVSCVSLSRDGRQVAAGTQDGRIGFFQW